MNIIEEIKSRINIVDIATELGLQPTRKDFIYSVYKEEKNRSLKLYRNGGRDVIECEYRLEFDDTACIWQVADKISELNLSSEWGGW